MKKGKKLLSSLLILAIFCSLLISSLDVSAASLLYEDFSDGVADGWTVVSGTWRVYKDTDGLSVYDSVTTDSLSRSVCGQSTWDNYSVEVKVKSNGWGSDSYGLGILGRYSDADNYYLFMFEDGLLKIKKKISGSFTTMASKAYTFNLDTWYYFKAVMNGTSLELYVNDTMELTATDNSRSTGKVGVISCYSDSRFDFVRVETVGAQPTPTPTPTPIPGPLYYELNGSNNSYIEAEIYTEKYGNFTQGTDAGASNDKYMYTPNQSGDDPTTHYINYNLDVTNGGTFNVWLRVNRPAGDGSSDSFNIAVDNGSDVIVYGTGTDAWGWKKAASTLSISSGSRVFKIKVREDGAMVDKVLFTKDSGFTPSGEGGAALTPKNSGGGDPTPTPTPQPGESPTPAPLNIINVSSASALQTALNNASAGDCIVLADGTYATSSSRFVISGRDGTSANPIVIKAANRGKATINGSYQHLTINNSNYVIVEGINFMGTDAPGVKIEGDSHHCRVTRCKFDIDYTSISLDNAHKWIYITGDTHHNRIDRNLFENKEGFGQCIAIGGNSTERQVSQYNQIDRNHFKNVLKVPESGGETVRIGVSGMSFSNGYNVVEYNLFEDCDGEAEIISNKNCYNTYRYNTFKACYGALTLRHGNNTDVYGNFFLGNGSSESGMGGIRMYGNDNRIYNNYFHGLTGTDSRAPILIASGSVDDSTNPSDFAKYYRVHRAIVVFNTIVNCAQGIQVGTSRSEGDLVYHPIDCVIANNVITGSQNRMIYEYRTPVNMTYSKNIVYPTGSATVGISKTQSQVWNTNPLLSLVGSLYKIASNSPAINYAGGTYSYVTDDMNGQVRDSTKDAGADQYSTGPDLRGILSSSQVGPNCQ